ncbi:MAG: aldo/keto reductase [Alphaproteobacteria bacterium]
MTTAYETIPKIGLGTFGLTGEAGLDAFASAIAVGYRHLDTAQTYGTEENLGKAVAQSGIDRDAFFITTKITASNLGRLEASVDDSLKLMGLDYADLVLIHWPAPNDETPVRDYIGDLARCQDAGKARLIGVSNFTRRHVDEAIGEIGEGRLATNQVEQHVFLQNRVLAEHCQAAGMAITAYRPLGGGGLDETLPLAKVARRHGAEPSQIALAYLLALGSIVIPKSATPDRQESNLAAVEIRLDQEDMDMIAKLDCGRRSIDPEWGPTWD